MCKLQKCCGCISLDHAILTFAILSTLITIPTTSMMFAKSEQTRSFYLILTIQAYLLIPLIRCILFWFAWIMNRKIMHKWSRLCLAIYYTVSFASLVLVLLAGIAVGFVQKEIGDTSDLVGYTVFTIPVALDGYFMVLVWSWAK